MTQSIVVQWDTLRVLPAAGIGNLYEPVGDPFEHVARLLIMQNLTDVQIFISDNGSDDKLTLPSGGQIILDYMSDKSATGGYFGQSVGTQIFIADDGVHPATTGNFYVSVIYAKGE